MTVQVTRDSTDLKNFLLAELPDDDERGRLTSLLRPATLRRGQVIYQPGDTMSQIYFPIDTAIALSFKKNGDAAAVGLIGSEGFVCLSALVSDEPSPFRYVAHLQGEMWMLAADVFRREFRQNHALQDAVLKFNRALLLQLSQAGFCYRRHKLDEQLARWLLMLDNRTGKNDVLTLTQEFLAEMLGARRASVTIALGALRDDGLIEMQRSQIRILDHQGLRECACECYDLIEENSGVLKRRNQTVYA